MELEKITISASTNTFEPEFKIELIFAYKALSRIFFKHTGFLYLDDYRVATLNEFVIVPNYELHLSASNKSVMSAWSHRMTLLAPFSRYILEKFEEARNNDKKADLNLRMVLELHVFEPEFDIHNTNEGLQQKQAITFSAHYNSIFKHRVYNFDRPLRIVSSDWIHDFINVFKNEKYQVFEIPVPELVIGEDNKLAERINGAIDSIREMEEEKIDGEWNNVVKASRPVWELIKYKDEIMEVLKSDDLNDATVDSFNNLMNAFFDFSSKFVHKESKAKEIMSNKASKEDAELIYSMSVSIVNLIAKKMNKLS